MLFTSYNRELKQATFLTTQTPAGSVVRRGRQLSNTTVNLRVQACASVLIQGVYKKGNPALACYCASITECINVFFAHNEQVLNC